MNVNNGQKRGLVTLLVFGRVLDSIKPRFDNILMFNSTRDCASAQAQVLDLFNFLG